MKKNLQVVLMFFFALATQFAFAQERMINGTIVDDQGMPLPGVNVIVQNTNRGVQTDFDGHFSIAASTGEVLEFSYVGFTSQTVTIGPDMQDLSIILGEDAAQLDEVVVVGYGTQSKRQLTDNVAKLTSEDIAEVPTPSLQSSLSGKAAGVQVTQTNGKVEGGINIRIRGIASVGAGSEPLYVLDGVPLINNNESNNGAPTNPLLTLSSNEIESIDILKDASAAAVYGSRGANGVVIITTKKGGNNKGTFAVNYSYGISETANRRDWLNADQYIELFTEAAINSYGEADGLAEAEGTFGAGLEGQPTSAPPRMADPGGAATGA